MKNKMIIAVALVAGMLSVGAVSASAAVSDGTAGSCTGTQVKQQFAHEVSGLTSAVKAKESQLRNLYGSEGVDAAKADALEAQIKELKGRIRVIANRYGIPACCLG